MCMQVSVLAPEQVAITRVNIQYSMLQEGKWVKKKKEREKTLNKFTKYEKQIKI